jgi:hypothetical protein
MVILNTVVEVRMKACPTCKRTYADETLTFCLVDGSILSPPYDSSETRRVPDTRETDTAPTEVLPDRPKPSEPITPPLSTIQSPGPPPLYSRKQQTPPRHGISRKPWIILGVAISLFIIFAVATISILVWLLKDREADNQAGSKVSNINSTPAATPQATIEDVKWGPRYNYATTNGDTLTYYRGTTPDRCQEDCAKNSACKGFTFIRAGAYNPGDSAMCYQVALIKDIVPHKCCITAVKR